MAISIKHAKTNNITDWTQAQLDSIIAGNPAPLPPAGTVLNDVTLPSDWNHDHTLSGGGSNQVLYTDNSGALAQSANLLFDGSLATLKAGSLGTTQVDTKGLLLTNTTAAAVGAQQMSPALHLQGQVWNTTNTASQPVDWIADVLPVQNTGPFASSSVLRLSSSVNGSSYAPKLSLTSAGSLSITGTFTVSNIIATATIRSPEFYDSNNFKIVDNTNLYWPGGYGGGLVKLADNVGKLYVPATLNFTTNTTASVTNGTLRYDATAGHFYARIAGTEYQLDQQSGGSSTVNLPYYSMFGGF